MYRIKEKALSRCLRYLQVLLVLVDVVQLQHVGMFDELQDGYLPLHLHRHMMLVTGWRREPVWTSWTQVYGVIRNVSQRAACGPKVDCGPHFSPCCL